MSQGHETETNHPEHAEQEQPGCFSSSRSWFASASHENKADISMESYQHCMNKIARSGKRAVTHQLPSSAILPGLCQQSIFSPRSSGWLQSKAVRLAAARRVAKAMRTASAGAGAAGVSAEQVPTRTPAVNKWSKLGK